ncbi:hypothetical protein [Kitasatospora sp. NPDC059327]|uniref:hypothetical protein n=1 Tax=Kitasatospora sp. NPDC059327 TaxID=3346803 RepID=UPI003694E1E5
MTQVDRVHAATTNPPGSDPTPPPAQARLPLARRLRSRLAKMPRHLRIGRWEVTAGPYDLFIDRNPKPGCTTCQDHRGWYREDGWEHCDCMTHFSSWSLPWRPTRPCRDEPPF